MFPLEPSNPTMMDPWKCSITSEPSPLTDWVHDIRRYSAYYQRRKVKTNPATNLIYSGDLPGRYAGVAIAHSL